MSTIMNTKTVVTFHPQEQLLRGVDTLADAVCTTLGPRGRNVALAKFTGDNRVYERSVVHDGVTVAKAIDLPDEIENMGAQLLKQAAQKQVQDVGDGTTVAVLLAQHLLKEINLLVAAGANPMELRSKIEDQVKMVIEEIKRLSIPVTDKTQKVYIATVSAEDPELGKLVTDVIEEMGVDGLVMVEESKNNKTTVEKQEGMQLDKGWLNQYFVTNPDRMEAVLQSPRVLVTDRDINSLVVIKDIVEGCANSGTKLLIISPNVGMDALGALIQNKMNGVLSCLAINAPSFGNNQKGILQDIAIFTGGKFISADAGLTLEKTKLEDLGYCDSVSAT
jgi:chaperonin GroEL